MKRLYDRTEKRILRYISGVLIAGSGGVVLSYLVSLAATPFFSGPTDYRYKFWAVFIGLSVIAVIMFPLISLIIIQKLEWKESGEEHEN
jgi:hypothetical protein